MREVSACISQNHLTFRFQKDLLAKKTCLENITQRQAAAYNHYRKEFEDLQLSLKEAILKMQSHGIAELEHILPG